MEEQNADPLIGRLISDRYRIRSALGEGAMGAVYLADHIWLERGVAVKVVRSDVPVSARALRRLHREARAIARIRHPNVVSVFDYGETEERWPFLVMEHVEGTTATRYFRRNSGARDVLFAAEAMLAGLGAAHTRGVLHRDLKPANMVVRGGDPAQLVLLDFGIAAVFGEERDRDHHVPATADGAERLTHAGTVVGTPLYMSPEQAMGEEATPLSDLYSVGVVLYEWVSGETPFTGGVTDVLRAQAWAPLPPLIGRPGFELSRRFHDAIVRALEKEPGARWPSAAVFREEVRRCIDELMAPSDESLPSAAISVLARPAGRAAVAATLPEEGGQTPMWGAPSREPAFVGRGAEQDRLMESLRAGTASGGGATLVRGEAGIGKSRLAQRVLERMADAGGHVIVSVRCEAGGRYWLEPVRAGLVDLLDGGRVGAGRALVEAGQLPGGAPLPMSEGERRELAQWLWPAGEPALGDAQRLLGVAELCLRALAARRPVLWWFDDLHEADSGTLQWIERFASGWRVRPCRVAFLLCRDDAPATSAPAARTERTAAFDRLLRHEGEGLNSVELPRMAHADLGALLAGIAPFDAEVVRRLCAWSTGLPLLAVQIARHLHASGRLVPGPEGLRPAGGDDLRGAVPSSLEALLQAERELAIGGAPDSALALRVLEAGAILGDSWDVAAVAAVLAATGQAPGGGDLDACLDHFVAVGILAEPAGASLDRLAWDPALHRDALLAPLQGTRRGRRLGRAAADALLQDGTLRGPARDRALAELYLIAGDRPAAAPFALRAGRHALYSGEIAEAERLLKVAEAPGQPTADRAWARILLGQTELRSGDGKRAAEWFRLALDGAEAPEIVAEAWLGIGWSHMHDGAPAQALPALQQARAALVGLPELPVALVSRILRAHAGAAADVAHAEIPTVDVAAFQASATTVEERVEVAKTLGILADLDGDVKTSVRCFSEALELVRDQGLRGDQVIVLCDLGRMLRRAGEDQAAAGRLREALDLARELGLFAPEAEAHNELGELARRAGDWAAAGHHYALSEERWELAGSDLGRIAALNRAVVSAESGAPAVGKATLDRVRSGPRGLPSYLDAAWSFIAALCAAAAAQVDASQRLVDAAIDAEAELQGAHDDAIDLLERIAVHHERHGHRVAAATAREQAESFRTNQRARRRA